jgi:hypothetical protein
MKRLFNFIVLFLFVGVVSASAYSYGPALEGSYNAVTVSVTAATSTTPKLVGASASNRSLAVLKNINATYNVYWGEGASVSTVNTWQTLAPGEETTIYTCNFAPGTWGYTNKGIYIYVSPTPLTADVVMLRSYKLLR